MKSKKKIQECIDRLNGYQEKYNCKVYREQIKALEWVLE